jgi:hypothetical protein
MVENIRKGGITSVVLRTSFGIDQFTSDVADGNLVSLDI